jgi:hypothetical protein
LLSFSDTNNNYKPLPFSFSRDSSGTVINKAGLIETVGSGEPRIDFKDNTKGALLLEPTRSNVSLNSSDWSGSGWIIEAATITDDEAISPSGSQDAELLTLTGSFGRIRQDFSSLSDNTTYTISSFFKAGTAYSFKMIFFNKANTETSYAFNLQDGTTDSGAIIEDYGNGWYRCSFSADSGSGVTTPTVRFASHNTGFTGGWTTGLTIYAWGAQLEQGSYATSYIPTSGSAVTRVYDTIPNYLDVTPLNIGNSYTLFLDADLNVNNNNSVFGIINNSIGTLSFSMRNNVGGIRLYNHIDTNYPVSGITSNTNKFVIRVDGNSYKIFVQGTSLSGTLTTQRDLGSLNFYGQITELKINNFKIDDTALSDAECESLVS